MAAPEEFDARSIRRQIRVFVWSEVKTQKSVFTETIQARRGKAKLAMLQHPITLDQLEEV